MNDIILLLIIIGLPATSVWLLSIYNRRRDEKFWRETHKKWERKREEEMSNKGQNDGGN